MPPLRRNPVPTHIRSTRRNPITDLREFAASGGYDAVQKAVFRHAPEVEWYKDDFDALDGYAISILEKNGMDVDRNVLGSGAMARVYPLAGDPDWVVKITTDPTDAALMAEAQFAGSLRGTPGIPKVASVFDLGPSPVRPDRFPGHIYAIVVERMTPLEYDDKLKVRALAKRYERGWLADPATVAERLKKAEPGSVEEAWLRGVAFVYAMGFRPTDFHANNIMQRRDGSYAFSDFGVSGVEGRAASRDIPALGDFASKKKAKSLRARSKAAVKRETDALYADLVALGFDPIVEALKEASASEATRPVPRRRKNPMPTAEELLAPRGEQTNSFIVYDLSAYPDTHAEVARAVIPDARLSDAQRLRYWAKRPPRYREATPAEVKRDEAARRLEAIIQHWSAWYAERIASAPPREHHRIYDYVYIPRVWTDMLLWLMGKDEVLGKHEKYLFLLDQPNTKNKQTYPPTPPFTPLQERKTTKLAFPASSFTYVGRQYGMGGTVEGLPEATDALREFSEAWHAFDGVSRVKTVSGRTACSRCGGSGKLREYSHVEGGVCFKCGGSGRTGGRA